MEIFPFLWFCAKRNSSMIIWHCPPGESSSARNSYWNSHLQSNISRCDCSMMRQFWLPHEFSAYSEITFCGGGGGVGVWVGGVGVWVGGWVCGRGICSIWGGWLNLNGVGNNSFHSPLCIYYLLPYNDLCNRVCFGACRLSCYRFTLYNLALKNTLHTLESMAEADKHLYHHT